MSKMILTEIETVQLSIDPPQMVTFHYLGHVHVTALPNFLILMYNNSFLLFHLWRLTLVLSCAMKFETYPHDTQVCNMQIESRKHFKLTFLVWLCFTKQMKATASIDIWPSLSSLSVIQYLTQRKIWFSNGILPTHWWRILTLNCLNWISLKIWLKIARSSIPQVSCQINSNKRIHFYITHSIYHHRYRRWSINNQYFKWKLIFTFEFVFLKQRTCRN